MPRARLLAGWSALVPALAVPVIVLLSNSVRPQDIAIYAVYAVAGVLVPGVLLGRAVLGASPLLLADLAVGAAVGMVLQLGAWFVAVGLGAGAWMWLWPLAVYVPFALVPSLRRHWRRPEAKERTTLLLAWVLGLSVAVLSVWFTGLFSWTQVLDKPHQWPFDMYWHLSLVELFARQVAPEDAQVAGHHLVYHWFGHADVAAASLMTGLDPALLLTRLWVVPLVMTTVGLLVALLREISPRAQPMAAVAIALLASRAALDVVPWLEVPWDNTFAPFSPSQNYSYPFLLLTLLLLVRYLRHGGLRVLAPLALLLLLSPGVKATQLPIILSGLLLALVVTALRRAPLRRITVATATTAVSLVVGTLLIGAGGAAGSGVQLLSSLSRNPVYFEYVGLTASQAKLHSGLLPPHIATTGGAAVAALLLLATVLKYLWVLPGWGVLERQGSGEADPVAWLLFGGGLAGWLLMLLVDQSGLSQVYFLSTGVVLWFVLAGWGLVAWADVVRAGSGRQARTVVVASSAVGTVLGLVLWRLPGVRPPIPQTPSALAAYLIPVAVALAVAVVAIVIRRIRSGGGQRTALALGTGLVAVAVASSIIPTATPVPLHPAGPGAVTLAETQAARFIARRAAPHDVVATNVHCMSGGTKAACDGRAFWVSALTRHRTFVGGWAYLDETRAMPAVNGRPDTQQPYFDQPTYQLNQALFSNPRAETASALRARGVEWVYADLHRGPVSDRLADVADLAYENADVQVYRLRPDARTPG